MTLTDDDVIRLQDAIDAAAAFVVELGDTAGGWEASWPTRRRRIPRRHVQEWLDDGMPPAHVIVAAAGAEIVADDVDLDHGHEVERDDRALQVDLHDRALLDARPPAKPRRASSLPPSSRRP